ncbi:hypothetical protein BC628DRAFT_1401514 [Trametes gibbosa]|nr:hypothetical protein BC628DRAFT_1401514 [Trametes gibbosa]
MAMNTTRDMLSLPYEVLEDIFQLACVDGGFTGCSLALTSRAIRDTARTTRFRSVSLLAHPRRVDSLLSLYHAQRRIPGAHKPQITHLYLTLPPGFRASTAPAESLRAFFSATAEDLHSLVVQVNFLYYDGYPDTPFKLPIISRPLPRLREITTVNLIDPRILADGDVRPLFPAATHLHSIPTTHSSGDPGSLPGWSAHAPNATHLRISGIDPIPSRYFQRALQAALDLSDPELRSATAWVAERATPVPAGEPASPPATAAAPIQQPLMKRHPHLRCIALQTWNKTHQPDNVSYTYLRSYGFGMWLASVSAYPAYEGLRICALEPCDIPVYDPSVTFEPAWAYWVDRMQGGPGCWQDAGLDE